MGHAMTSLKIRKEVRVLASCRIIIFRKAAKQSMTSLQDDINIVCGVALLTKNSKKSGLCKYFKN